MGTLKQELLGIVAVSGERARVCIKAHGRTFRSTAGDALTLGYGFYDLSAPVRAKSVCREGTMRALADPDGYAGCLEYLLIV